MAPHTTRCVLFGDVRGACALSEVSQLRQNVREEGPRKWSRRKWLRVCESLITTLFLESRCSSQARIPTESFPRRNVLPPPPRAAAGRDVKEDVLQIQDLTKQAEKASSEGQFQRALELYTRIVEDYSDLAVTEYARLHRALLLYEVGDIRESLLELDDLEVSLRGLPEVHAALASLIYVERPLQLSRSEEQWELATAFDTRYNDPSWVSRTKKWPPKMIKALMRFLELR